MPPTKSLTRPAWHEAYDAQMALWRWYRRNQGVSWLVDLYRAQTNDAMTPGMVKQMQGLFDAEQGKLISLDPLYVSEEMSELVEVARDSFAPEPLLMSDLPTPRGFLWYAKPIVIPTRDGSDSLPIRALSWAQQYRLKEGVDPVAFVERLNDPDRWEEHGSVISQTEQDEFVAEGLQEATGIAVTLYVDSAEYLEVMAHRGASGERLEYSRFITADVPVVPVHLAPWWYGMSFEGNEFDLDERPTGADGWWRLAQTTLRLMQQKLSTKSFGRPQRATRREATRLGFPPETEVVIVRLRREGNEHHEPSGEPANYSHRFIVGGHWRNQWYPSEKIHRQIYIAPYVKGPEDKPLIVRPRRVFQWQR